MRLDGRRVSGNVRDIRGKGGKAAGIGIGGVIVIGLITLLMGGNPLEVLNMVSTGEGYSETYTPTAEEEELATFAKQILAGTEDVWTDIFKQMGLRYEPPTLVLFSGSVQSGCGGATASTGPFYCSADKSVYLDLSFFTSMKKEFGTAGDFAYAYVIAHEVGHHVQNLLGTLRQAHTAMSQAASQAESNKISVRLELQADFYAGVWAHHDNEMFNSLEPGDIEEGIAIASRIGDDYLQKQARGYAVPDSFNHGTSAQRVRWLKRGFEKGDPEYGDTFSPDYNRL
ncbi:MAG: neutral zinc metallopeptidase [Candidatus Cryptobacteroides sp.]|nr:neutral zinc metallopeptidase [Bacteroidales bacterium]MDD7082878.1 zinc metallopeptidase [Bacteroidales bacterium]MDY3227316.1 neutral zinc metallopeptidase [Candidatus Cryptobacteroides sp.]MDY5261854.1 neutral zinc metallopeptidase [Candidatus Cryptobacteroides sp.]MDY6183121.1 neutral zinc metallopeptidase [Candidatus Cryptobacteroides sp.]